MSSGIAQGKCIPMERLQVRVLIPCTHMERSLGAMSLNDADADLEDPMDLVNDPIEDELKSLSASICQLRSEDEILKDLKRYEIWGFARGLTTDRAEITKHEKKLRAIETEPGFETHTPRNLALRRFYTAVDVLLNQLKVRQTAVQAVYRREAKRARDARAQRNRRARDRAKQEEVVVDVDDSDDDYDAGELPDYEQTQVSKPRRHLE